MNNYITYVGIDVHKSEHKVFILFPDSKPPQEMKVLNHEREIKRFIKRLKQQAPGEIRVCYEAGPCGFELHRRFEAEGISCDVIAPSCTPVKPGERIKTDRRDARKLAEYYRNGLLTPIHPPTAEEEGVRDLCRCWEAAKRTQKRAQHQLSKFLLRQGRHFCDGNMWTHKHFGWMKKLSWSHPVQQRVFDDYLVEVERCLERVKMLEEEIDRLAQQEPYRKPVGWLRCFRGVDTITAMVLITELYAFSRFHTARDLMAFLGLTPSEMSSGETRRKGSLTKTGNTHVRRLLVEAAWHQRLRVHVGGALKKRRKGQPTWVIAEADKAMRRLYKRYHVLLNKGKSKQVVVTAIARELVGFLWVVLIRYGEEAAASMATPAAPTTGNAF